MSVPTPLSGLGRGKPITDVSLIADVLSTTELRAVGLSHRWLFFFVASAGDVVWKHFAYGRRADILFVRRDGDIHGAIVADGRYCERPDAAKRPRAGGGDEFTVVYPTETIVPVAALLLVLETRPVERKPLISRWAVGPQFPKALLMWYFRSFITRAVSSQATPPPAVDRIVWPNLAAIGHFLDGESWRWSDSGRFLTARFETSGAIGHHLVATRRCSLARGNITATGDQFSDAIEPSFVRWIRTRLTRAVDRAGEEVDLGSTAGVGPADQSFFESFSQSIDRQRGKGMSGVKGVPRPPMCVRCAVAPNVPFKNGIRWQLAQVVVDLERCLPAAVGSQVQSALVDELLRSGQSADRIRAFTSAIKAFRRKSGGSWPCVNRVAGRSDLFCPRIAPGMSPGRAVQECMRDQGADITTVLTDAITPAVIWAHTRPAV